MAGVKRTDNKGRILKDGETQRKDGTYRYTYTDANGARHDVYSRRLVPTDRLPPGCKDSLSLREKAKKIVRDLDDGIKAAVENKATLNDLFVIHMGNKQKLKGSTRGNYLYMYHKYIAPILGNRKVSSIKYTDVKRFYNDLIEHGFKINSLEGIHTILNPIFRLAVKDNYIRANPAEGVMAEIKQENHFLKPKRHALTIPEQEAFMEYVKNHKIYNHWATIFTFMLGTGCRIGEVVGIRWEDCDFEHRVISIRQNLLYRRYDIDQKTRFHVETPKTEAGIRYIPMLDQVKEALETEMNRQKIIGFNDSVVDGYTGFVFQNRYGDPMSPHNINRAIDRICAAYIRDTTAQAEKDGVEPVMIRHFSNHSLRHTFCTRFCENETNLKVIQDVMGHKDIRTTMEVYAEATMEKKQESFANLEGKIKIS